MLPSASSYTSALLNSISTTDADILTSFSLSLDADGWWRLPVRHESTDRKQQFAYEAGRRRARGLGLSEVNSGQSLAISEVIIPASPMSPDR